MRSFKDVSDALTHLLQTALKAYLPDEDHQLSRFAMDLVVEEIKQAKTTIQDQIKQMNDLLAKISTAKEEGAKRAQELNQQIDRLTDELIDLKRQRKEPQEETFTSRLVDAGNIDLG